jgi:hypothetical protein
VLGSIGCLAEPAVDLGGPQVIDSDLPEPRSVEIPVWPSLEFRFSEPLAPGSVHAGSVVLIEWEDVGSCAMTPLCEEGSCERGRCQEDPLNKTELGAIGRGEGVPGSIALDLWLDEVAGNEGEQTAASVLRVRPKRSLRERSRFSLVLGEAIEDEAGSPLESELGVASNWRRDFVTSTRGSSGPEPSLVAPVHGQNFVPTNLEWLETGFDRGVVVGGRLFLELEGGGGLELSTPSDCEGWLPGSCLRWPLIDELASGQRYSPGPALFENDSVSDHAGRRAVPVHGASWFRTGAGADLTPPAIGSVVVQQRSRCLTASLESTEAVELRLIAAGREASVTGDGVVRLGLSLDGLEVAQGELVKWRIEARDLAGNVASEEGDLLLSASFDGSVPRLWITEILANPAGPEPHQEFVELASGEHPAFATGLFLADLGWAEIVARLETGGTPPGDELPAFELQPGAVAVVTGSGYQWESELDPRPAPGATVLQVDASLGQSGLKNGGEPLSLYRANPPALVSSYGNSIETDGTAFNGRSVAAVDPRGCDLPNNWRAHPLGTSTPGMIP